MGDVTEAHSAGMSQTEKILKWFQKNIFSKQSAGSLELTDEDGHKTEKRKGVTGCFNSWAPINKPHITKDLRSTKPAALNDRGNEPAALCVCSLGV